MGAAAAEWFTVGVFAIGTVLPAMQLITILNRCHRFRGFFYEGASFTRTERNTIEVRVRPRKGSAAICSGCHRPAAESRKMAQKGHEPLLKKSRWCVLKRKENLAPQQKSRLRDLLRYNLQTVRAYLFKEDFQQFWEYNSPLWAGMLLDFWCRQTMRSRIEPMKKIARMLRVHRGLLLNYFKAQKEFSAGVVEGLNNKAKVTMRESCGFRTFRITELALYHTLGRLPEPALAARG
jgi:transposase